MAFQGQRGLMEFHGTGFQRSLRCLQEGYGSLRSFFYGLQSVSEGIRRVPRGCRRLQDSFRGLWDERDLKVLRLVSEE